MKLKFIAGIALIAWLAVVGWLATMVIVKPAVLRLGNDSEETAAMSELRAAIARNKASTQEIATLRSISQVRSGDPLIALAKAPSSSSAGDAALTNGATGGDFVEHSVSMILMANGKRSAIVDGQPVKVGSRLSNGTRVRRIGADTVEIVDSEGETAVLKVRSPFLQQAGAGL